MNRKPLFSLSEFAKTPNSKQDVATSDKSEKALIKFEALHMEKVTSLKNLTKSLPAHGEIFFIWTLNSFNAFTFITHIIRECECIDHLVFSTYSINLRIVNSLMRWYDKGHIKQITILISDSIRYRVPKVNDLLVAQASTRNIRINYDWNHSKVTLMRSGDNYFVVEGSGNFSENAMNEQYIFLNNREVYEFRQRNIQNSIDRGTA